MTAQAVSFLKQWLKAVASITLTDWQMKSKTASPLKKQKCVFCMYEYICESKSKNYIYYLSINSVSIRLTIWVGGSLRLSYHSLYASDEKGRKIQQSPEPQRPVSIRQPLDLLCCCRNKGMCGRPSLSKESAIRNNTALSKPAALAVEDRWCHYGNCMLGKIFGHVISVVGVNPLAPCTKDTWHWHEWEMAVD